MEKIDKQFIANDLLKNISDKLIKIKLTKKAPNFDFKHKGFKNCLPNNLILSRVR